MRDAEHLTDEDINDIEAQIAEAARKKAEAKALPKGERGRRKGEAKTKGRVNSNLLRPGAGAGRDVHWTILVTPAHRKAVQELAEELSQPKAKVSMAALIGEAFDLLIAKYRDGVAEDGQG
jgi:hypothetical protein